jgi:hypothetical protein
MGEGRERTGRWDRGKGEGGRGGREAEEAGGGGGVDL